MSHHKGARVAFTLRIPVKLHERLTAAAMLEGSDLNDWILGKLEPTFEANELNGTFIRLLGILGNQTGQRRSREQEIERLVSHLKELLPRGPAAQTRRTVELAPCVGGAAHI